MAERLERNLDFIKVLTKAKPKQRKAILHTADRDLILCLCEVILNFLSGNLKTPENVVEQLRKHKTSLRALSKQDIPFKQRKEILEQKGGFLPILLTPLLTITGQLLAEALTKRK